MNHAHRLLTWRSAGALLLAMIMLCSCLPAMAQPVQTPLTVAASWTSPDGSSQTTVATLVPYPGYENAYWLHLPEEAVQVDAALSITDNTGLYPGGFTLPQGQPISALGYIDAGVALTDTPILFQGLDMNGAPVQEFKLFISTMADTPEAPLPTEASPVSVPVHYVNAADNTPLMEGTTLSVMPGESATATAPAIEGFTPDTTERTVSVDQNGMANPAELIFRYTKNEAPEPQSVNVPVYYINAADNTPLMEGTTLSVMPGESATATAPAIEGFTPDMAEQTVSVDQNGMANPAELIFRYTKNEAPEPQSVNVPVYYVNAADNTPLMEGTTLSVMPGESATATAPAIEGFTPDMAEQTVTVDQNGMANPAEVIFRYTKNEAPEPQSVNVSVYYINDADEQQLIPETVLTIERGQSATATAAPIDGFAPMIAEQVVTVDENGVPTPSMVTFRYRALVSEPVNINIHYVDENRAPVASSQTFAAKDGTNTIQAAPTDLKEGYRLKDSAADTQYVIVSNNTADKTDVYFEYTNAPLPAESNQPDDAPAPKVAIVPVYYRDQFGKPLIDPPDSVTCVEGEDNTISVDVTRVDGKVYELTSAASQNVSVDANGVATPSEVVFLFKDLSVGRTASLNIHGVDQDNQELFVKAVEIQVGEQAIKAPAAPDGYEPATPESQTVTLGRDGTLTPGELFFTYAKKQAPAEPTPFPYTIEPADEYAFPRKDNTNFRSSPTSADNSNVLSVVGSKDLIHIEGSLVNNKDEVWYYGKINGVQGFIKENVIRKITTEEAYKVLGYTPIPQAEQTPTASPIADGTPINRWGATIKGSVKFRKTTSTRGKPLDTLSKDTKVFVYQQQSGDNEKWYAVVYKNKEGFIMADLVELLSQEESDKIQAGLSSPVPARTLPPMAEETPKPTPKASPTVKPTAAPASPVPEAYTGYALTTRPVQLRTGVGGQNEYVITTLPQNALVWVSAQAYNAGRVWDLVEALAEKQNGYVEDAALRRLSQQEAQPYLNALSPKQAPPVVQQQVTGYAITLGNNVPMRTYFSTNAQYTYNLSLGEVVQVLGQESGDGHVWHVVGYKGTYGFIRADQLRMMNAAEEAAYLASVRTTPIPVQPTVQPLNPGSLSSYGYVNADKVRMRKEPDLNAAYIKMMDKNAFALVLGTVSDKNNNTWYHINQAGTDGYVMGTYFTILPMNQLATFLRSPEYLNANTSSNSSAAASGRITPVEDFNTEVWKNPSLAQASYEPFNPIGTATPSVEAILTPTVEPSASPEPTISVSPLATEAPAVKTSSFPTGLLAITLLAVFGGGGYYAYYLYKQNQQRAAARNAKRRQMMQEQQARTPQQRPAQPQNTSAFRPPHAAGQQGTVPFKPQQPTQGTAPFRPQQPTQGTAPFKPQQPTQGTAPFRPQQPTQGTAPFRPEQPTQGTVPFRPEQPTQNTMPYQPGNAAPSARPVTPSAVPSSPQQTGTPVAGVKAPHNRGPADQAPASEGSVQPGTASEPVVRRRRSDRHGNEN